jgi:uncharacterized protein (TIGR03437 family)
MNGENAFVYYTSPNQVNVLTPPDLAPGVVQVTVTMGRNDKRRVYSLGAAILAFLLHPRCRTLHSGHARRWEPFGPTSLYPGLTTLAAPGEVVILHANGFSPVSAPVAAGSDVQSGNLPALGPYLYRSTILISFAHSAAQPG